MHYYQHHIGDFIKDTNFLTNEEVGIYLNMLWLYYDTEKPLPNSLFQISMKVNARDKEELIEGLLNMFFALQDGAWHHKRCDKEIEQYHKQVQTASKAGKASAAKRAQNRDGSEVQRPFNDRSTTEQLTNNHKPITNKDKGLASKPDDVSDQIWSDFLRVRKAHNAPLTKTAFARLITESVQAKMSLEDVLKLCIEKNWRGFQAEWLANQKPKPVVAGLDPFASRGGV